MSIKKSVAISALTLPLLVACDLDMAGKAAEVNPYLGMEVKYSSSTKKSTVRPYLGVTVSPNESFDITAEVGIMEDPIKNNLYRTDIGLKYDLAINSDFSNYAEMTFATDVFDNNFDAKVGIKYNF